MEELLSYIPKAAHIQIESFLRNMDVNIIVTKQRLTKHGDFRFHPNKKPIITVNNSLNPYRFLITLLHELAHFKEKEHNKAFYKLCEYMQPSYHQVEFDLRLYLTCIDMKGKFGVWN